ncbi:hypothetical protein ACP3V3_02425 [Vibrio sp. PNB22_3_1]
MNGKILNLLRKGIDEIKRNKESTVKSTLDNGVFKTGFDMRLFRVLTGISQLRLSESIDISRHTIGKLERSNKKIPYQTSAQLTQFMLSCPNAKAVEVAMNETDSQHWHDWIFEHTGLTPKVRDVKCTKCESLNVTFTTRNESCVLAKLHCTDCGSQRYSSNAQYLRTEKWQKAPTINPYVLSDFLPNEDTTENITFCGSELSVNRVELIALRKELNISQSAFSKKLDISLDVLKRTESGRRQIDNTINKAVLKCLVSDPRVGETYTDIKNRNLHQQQ